MNALEIKAARARLGYRQRHMANYLGISVPAYNRKENGKARFSDHEKVELAKLLGFSLVQTNDYLYDGILPIEK